ncbi:tetratricopeptide repeat protein [Marinobacter daqiaonensis]|uniref:tetratricopeptide repeat protein n=1 Tax=Marinobacter daqiaonensis TaxID=650891 RepID=UPI0014330986|nr:tetratricopeptide repeat protein [Marinobacter daqiaonensis]
MLGNNKQSDIGRKSTETTTSLLTQVNQLVTQGLRQAAIELLEEAISDSPDNTSFLSALGRVYLLDRQPEKAVVYLRRSLAKTNSNPNPVSQDDYSPEAFSDADADYIEELAEESSNDEFSPLEEVRAETVEDKAPNRDRSGTLHLKRQPEKRDTPETPDDSEPQVTIIRRGRAKRNDPVPVDIPHAADEAELDETGRADLEAGTPDSAVPEAIKPRSEASDEASSDEIFAAKQTETPDHSEAQLGLSFESDDGSESPEDSLDLPDDESNVLDIVDVEDDFDDDLDEVDSIAEAVEDYPLDEFESEDFGWEDLDDFDEEASRENADEDLTLVGIPREQRARQAAVDVLERVGWDREYLPLLESIFVESGWGAARIAIENQIERGAVPEQIVLARQVRSIWFSNEHLWTTFRMRSNSPFMQAQAVYKNFSWADALRLIGCFTSIPDESEVEAFIEEVYEEWYSSNRLRLHFNAFYKYLRYRIGLNKRTLSDHLAFVFSLPVGAERGMDDPELGNENSDMRNELSALGVELRFRPTRIVYDRLDHLVQGLFEGG